MDDQRLGKKYLSKLGNIINYVSLPIIILLLWIISTNNEWITTTLLPTVPSVAKAFQSQIATGQLQEDLVISITRVLKGFLLSSLLGITLGVFMGMSEKMGKFFALTFTSMRQIPMMAWIPLVILWAGIGEQSKVVIIVVASFFPILVNTMNGIRRTDRKLIEVGKMYKLSAWKLFTKAYFPSALPSILIGLKLGLGISWMAVVGAEMIAASSGIGFRINDARSLMQTPIVFSGMISIAVAGVLMDFILSIISKLATPWERRK